MCNYRKILDDVNNEIHTRSRILSKDVEDSTCTAPESFETGRA
jgi:hypothetical protein